MKTPTEYFKESLSKGRETEFVDIDLLDAIFRAGDSPAQTISVLQDALVRAVKDGERIEKAWAETARIHQGS